MNKAQSGGIFYFENDLLNITITDSNFESSSSNQGGVIFSSSLS
jgi:hypothetical protein